MTKFDERERAFEKRYADTLELEFKATARRNKLLGRWAAELLDLQGPNADDYATAIIESALGPHGAEGVFERVWGDLSGAGVEVTERQVRRHMDRLLRRARDQVWKEAYEGR